MGVSNTTGNKSYLLEDAPTSSGIKKYQNSVKSKLSSASSYLKKSHYYSYGSNTKAPGAINRVIKKINSLIDSLDDVCQKGQTHINNMDSYEHGKSVTLNYLNDYTNANIPSWANPFSPDFGTKTGLEVLGKCNKVVFHTGMMLVDLISMYGHDPSDIYKVLYDSNGNHYDASTMANIKEGETIYILYGSNNTSIFSEVNEKNIKADEIIINGLKKDYANVKTTRLGLVYGDYDGLTSPVGKENDTWGINERMGQYDGGASSGKVHLGNDLITVDGSTHKRNYQSAGKEIDSIADGVVLSSYTDQYGGNTVTIASYVGSNVLLTTYMHMQQPSSLKVGEIVKQGDKIGNVGETSPLRNNSVGNHLHIETQVITPNAEQQNVINNINSSNGDLTTDEVQKLINSGIKASTKSAERADLTFISSDGTEKKAVENGVMNKEYIKINNAPIEAIIGNYGIVDVKD